MGTFADYIKHRLNEAVDPILIKLIEKITKAGNRGEPVNGNLTDEALERRFNITPDEFFYMKQKGLIIRSEMGHWEFSPQLMQQIKLAPKFVRDAIQNKVRDEMQGSVLPPPPPPRRPKY